MKIELNKNEKMEDLQAFDIESYIYGLFKGMIE